MSFSFKDKNIIVLLKSAKLGGAERQALALSGYLQDNLHCNVFIYTFSRDELSPQFMDYCNQLGLKNVEKTSNPLNSSNGFKYLKRRLKLFSFALKLRKHKPDVIIPYLNNPSVIAALIRKMSGAKFAFWNNRGFESFRGDKLEQKAVAKTKLFVVNSPDSVLDIEQHLKVPLSKIHFIPNFSTIYDKEIGETKSSKNNELIIGMVAHFREEKLQMLLLESFNELSKKHDNIKLQLVGDAANKSLFDAAENYVKSNGLEDKVSFIQGKDARELIQNFDIGVLVSTKEGMSNAIMEYMYFELPIVCTNHKGNEILLGDGNEYLIKSEKQALTEKLEILINNKKIRQAQGKTNKNRINKEFTVEKYISNLETVINSLY